MEGPVLFLGIDVSSFRYSVFSVHTEIKGIRERKGRCVMSLYLRRGTGREGGAGEASINDGKKRVQIYFILFRT